MSQVMFEAKKDFVTHALSRCVSAMCPEVCRLEYHLHDDGDVRDEIVIIRHASGYVRRVSVAGLGLPEIAGAVLAEIFPEGC